MRKQVSPWILRLLALVGGWACSSGGLEAGDAPGVSRLQSEIRPLLTKYCYDCHGDGMKKGNVSFDSFQSDDEMLAQKDLWFAVLRNVRAGYMPPSKKPRPPEADRERLAEWIQSSVLGIDPRDPDPGRVTIRRLNRNEYRNTIRDLMGIDFETEREFPADDTGHGFDNMSDVLTLSPMLIEKYLSAANTIVERAVPMVPRVAPEARVNGSAFRRAGAQADVTPAAGAGRPERRGRDTSTSLSYYEAASLAAPHKLADAGRYQVAIDFAANEKFVDGQFDYNKCRLVFKIDGAELFRGEYGREPGKRFHFDLESDLQAGERALTFEVEPLTAGEKQVRSLSIRIDSVIVRGPMDEAHWARPKNYERFFIEEAPQDPAARLEHARVVLRRFTTLAFRRPADPGTVEKLADIARSIYTQPGKTFEAGVAKAMTAVLASPRFLFREESTEPLADGQSHPYIDQLSLASRLSYFFWSSMPDAELFRLASEKKLRDDLGGQVKRLLADPRSEALTRNFVGQWLQARDVETVPIDTRAVMQRETEPDPEFDRARQRFRELRDKPPEALTPEEKEELSKIRAAFFRSRDRFSRFELTGALRKAMQGETEKCFERILEEDRSLLELIDGDSTFLNQRLAEHYGIPGVEGDELRLVKLPEGSPRGGILTQGTFLAVTSNPTRTSPVKRGLFILENVFGAPPAPPPPNIPALEDAEKGIKGREPTLRETLAAHRDQPLCSSCHNRMDPLGLAFESFNALGRWRERERGQPIDVAGTLITGEAFQSVQELKKILVKDHAVDFYRCLTEKLLTYALGRGLQHEDVYTVDRIVERILKQDGRPSALLLGIVESAPFQKRRLPGPHEKLRAF